MKHVLFYIAILVIITVPVLRTHADMVSGLYHRDLPNGLLSDIDEHFPGNGRVDLMDPGMLTANANLYLSRDSSVSLTFLDEVAGFRNGIGYFTFDSDGRVLEETVVFSNYSKLNGGGVLTPGDTIDLGPFSAGTNIGFFIVPNMDRAPHYTLDFMNPNRDNYTAFYSAEQFGYGVLGFEDMIDKPSWGTAYDDAILGVTVSTVPEPATVCLLVFGGLVMISRRRKA